MHKDDYPIHLCFVGGYEQDGMPIQRIEHHGPFEEPGRMFRYSLREGFIGIDKDFRKDLKQYTKELKKEGKDSRSILMAYDDWAFEDMSNRDWGDGAQTVVVDEGEYQEMLKSEREKIEKFLPEPCNHIDAPCCGCGSKPFGHTVFVESLQKKK